MFIMYMYTCIYNVLHNICTCMYDNSTCTWTTCTIVHVHELQVHVCITIVHVLLY